MSGSEKSQGILGSLFGSLFGGVASEEAPFAGQAPATQAVATPQVEAGSEDPQASAGAAVSANSAPPVLAQAPVASPYANMKNVTQQCCYNSFAQQQQVDFDDFDVDIHRGEGHSISRLPAAKPAADGDEVSAVVVTICGGSSYDTLFSSVPLQSDEGTKVLGYSLTATQGVERLLAVLTDGAAALEGATEEERDMYTELVEGVDAVEPDCVVVNFECCSAYGDNGFGPGGPPPAAINLILRAVARGFMVMCSDFSLKALIATWEHAKGELGPCPFHKTGEFSGRMKLRFDPQVLARCERSDQLQKIGELCNEGSVMVACMGGTIGYGVDPKAADTPAYELTTLTVIDPSDGAGDAPPCPPELCAQAAGVSGPAGHVMLTYPSGGVIMASSGHWKALMDFDVSEEQVLNVANAAYGAAYMQNVEADLASYSGLERAQRNAEWSRQFVQQSAPCKMYTPRKKGM